MSSTRDEPVLGAHRKIYRASTDHDIERVLSACVGLKRYDIDLCGATSKSELLTAIAEAMELPDYFGMNWDALVDCLRDFADIESGGIVVLVRTGEELGIEENVWTTFISVFQDVAGEFEQDHGKLLALLLAQ